MRAIEISLKRSRVQLVLCFILLSLSSCSSDFEETEFVWGDPNYVDQTFFSPPEWIQGRWEGTIDIEGYENMVSFYFTKDNIVDPYYEDNNKALNFEINVLNREVSVEETISDDEYLVEVIRPSGNYQFYFEKLDDNTIIVLKGTFNYTSPLSRIP